MLKMLATAFSLVAPSRSLRPVLLLQKGSDLFLGVLDQRERESTVWMSVKLFFDVAIRRLP